jgi:hypothetical protein
MSNSRKIIPRATAIFIQLRNRERGQREIVGEKRQALRRLGIHIAHAPQLGGE